MEIFRYSILPQEEIAKKESFKAAINNCPCCDRVMRFEYTVDYLSNRIEEEAFCSGCAIKIRKESHQLQ